MKNPMPNELASYQCRTSTLYNVEFLRVVFTVFVLITNFFVYFEIWNSGGQAVQFFFLLSGYLLALTYKPERGIISFAVSRYIRFVPLVVLGGLLSGGQWKSLEGCLMLQNTGLIDGDIRNAPAWYISVLFWCSLFYLSVMKGCGKQTAMAIIAVVGFFSLLISIHVTGGRHALFAGFLPCGMFRGLSCMAIGILMAQLCKRIRGENVMLGQKLIYSVAEVFILTYILWGCFDQSVFPSLWVGQILAHVLLLYLFVMKRGWISSFLEQPVFAVLAKYSLAVYLTHWMFMTTIYQYVLSEFPGWIESHAAFSIAVAIIGAWIVGGVSHHLVEKPCTRYLTQFVNWLKPALSKT